MIKYLKYAPGRRLCSDNMKSTRLPSSLLLMLLLLEVSHVSSQERSRPNFVLMMVDDLGIGDLGCYGNTTLRTPNIDQLAQEGVKLTHHIAAASLCTPSRAAFLTGRYPIRSGIAGEGKAGVYIFTAASGGLPSHELTFAKIAKQQGYETALIGKWHLGLNCESSDDHCHHPSIHGFNYFFGIPLTNLRDCQPGHGTVFQLYKYIPYRTLSIVLATAALLHYIGFITIRRGVILSLLSLLVIVTALIAGFIMVIPYLNCILMRDHRVVEQPFTTEKLTQRMTHEAVDFIERNSARPFLLFFSFLHVHTALFTSAAFRGTSRHGLYGDAVHEVDWSVGRSAESALLKGQVWYYSLLFGDVNKSHKKTKTDTGPLTVLSDFPSVSVGSKAIRSSLRCTFLKAAYKYRFIFITRFINPILKQLTTVQCYSNPRNRDYFQKEINTHLVPQCGSYMHFL